MKKILLIISALVIGYMMYTHALPTLPTGPAPMTSEQVGVATAKNFSIISQNAVDATATIEIRDPDNNRKATFIAPLIDTYGSNVVGMSIMGCALINTSDPRFYNAPRWATTMVEKYLGSSHYGVLCKSGTLYTNVDVVKGGTGWQPGYLAYSNYLGNVYVGSESKNLGAADLLNICSGTCQPIK